MGMLSTSPPWVPCKAPCVSGMFLPEGRLLSFWCLLLFQSFLWIIQVSQGQQLLGLKPQQCWGSGHLLAPPCTLARHGGGFLSRRPQLLDSLCWDAVGEQWVGRRPCCSAVFENKVGFF